MTEKFEEMSMFDLDIWSGKMSPEPSVQTKQKTSASSSKKQRGSKSRMPLFLNLQKANGQQADVSWETDGVSLGEFSMHSFTEHPVTLYHNGVGESHLSQILEDNPHPKYYLSAKACQGILNRASRRGKKLPQMLQEALLQMIEMEKALTATTEISLELSPPLSASDDATTWKHGEFANTLNTFDQGEARANELAVESQPVICLQGNGIGRADTAGCNGKGVKEDVAYTLNTIDRHAVAYKVDEKTGNTYTWEEQANTLAARDYKQPQAVAYHDTNESPGLTAEHSHYIVRRLTPLECERLQGYPDGWTDIGEYTETTGKTKKSSDAARYKALGNSIALPPWKWVMKRISACYERCDPCIPLRWYRWLSFDLGAD